MIDDKTGGVETEEALALLRTPQNPPSATLPLPLSLVKTPPPAAKEAVGSTRPSLLSLLVKDDTDTTGLLAYSLHTLSKRDWLAAFSTSAGREPNPEELNAFIIGEQTARRVAAYRSQAERMIERERRQSADSPDPAGQSLDGPERPKIATILHHLTRTPITEPIKGDPKRMANGNPVPPGQPNLKTLLRYLLILAGLVTCLAILVNYAKSTVFSG